MLSFKQWLIETAGAFVTQELPSAIGSGHALTNPSIEMQDKTDACPGTVVFRGEEEGNSMVDKEEGKRYVVIKIQTKNGISQIKLDPEDPKSKLSNGASVTVVFNRDNQIQSIS